MLASQILRVAQPRPFLATRKGEDAGTMHQLVDGGFAMSRRLVLAMLGLGLALFLFLMPQVSLAAEDHIAEAITYATQAIDHGKMGHPNVLATHAELALTNATASEKAKANSHTEEGKKGHADVATTQAEVALTHLEQVK
jgi:Small metal-binding protein